MSSYYTRCCLTHGDWEQDIDRPGDECPDCEKAGTTPMQLKDKRIAELGAEVARLKNTCKWCGVPHKLGQNTLCPFTIATATLLAVGELPVHTANLSEWNENVGRAEGRTLRYIDADELETLLKERIQRSTDHVQ